MPEKKKKVFGIDTHKTDSKDWFFGLQLTHDADFEETYICINFWRWTVIIGLYTRWED